MATDTVENSVLQAPAAGFRPNVDHLVTEDDTPVDNVFSEKQQRLLSEPLFSSWAGPGEGRPFVAMSNVGLFYAVHRPPYVPDMMLSLDVDLPEDLWAKEHRSYFVWEYGKMPEVVVEVVSNREGGENSDKLTGYARIGICYYVIYDPDAWLSADPLRAFKLDGRKYRPLAEPISFPEIGLGLRIWQGRYEDMEAIWLRWVDAEGQLIKTGSERADEEQARADEEQARADEERARAQVAQERARRAQEEAQRAAERADRLAEQLRRLGVEPES